MLRIFFYRFFLFIQLFNGDTLRLNKIKYQNRQSSYLC